MEKLISEMSTEEYLAVIKKYIERESQDTEELPAPVFYQTFQDIWGLEKVEETIELEANLVDGQLQLQVPVPHWDLSGVAVHDNEIIVDNLRFIIRLAEPVPALV